VRTADGQGAYLKVTPAMLGPEAIAAALRELRFYQDLAPLAPVRTPRLFGHLDAEDGVAVLLEAAGEAQEPGAWTARMWADLGRELAGLHSMPLPTGVNWSRPDALRAALADPDMEQIHAFWAPTLPRLPELLARRGELEDQMDALPPVFIHGDCHTDNLVYSAGTVVFCDWQAAGIGRPASDLAFLSVRSTPAGTTVPQLLIDAYLDSRPCERRTLQRALLAEELAIFLLLWPSFATFNSPMGIACVRRRTLELAERWFDA
jgi:aminoglycoside phosphotransferase (APT) family kinase protein